MNLSEVYKKKCALATKFLEQSRYPAPLEIQNSYSFRAIDFEEQSAEIAHCIAMYGDLAVGSIDFSGPNESSCVDGPPVRQSLV